MTAPSSAELPAPLVSVVIPAFNSERYLPIAVDSALEQTFQDHEVIIVDDGSTDGTGRIADDYQRRQPDRVRVIHQPNAGLAEARNAAIRIARGKYLALLDSDDAWLPHHLSRSVTHLEAHPGCGLVHANIQRIDEEGKPLSVPIRRWGSDASQAWDRLFVRDEHVSCCTTVFRKAVIDRIGAFDHAFNRVGCEDRDLWLNIMAVSDAHFFDEVNAQYRVHSGNWSKSREKMEQAALRLIDKHAATPRGQRLARRARATVWLEAGECDRMIAHRAGHAVRNYLKTLFAWPACRPAWAGLVKLAIGRTD